MIGNSGEGDLNRGVLTRFIRVIRERDLLTNSADEDFYSRFSGINMKFYELTKQIRQRLDQNRIDINVETGLGK